MVGHPPGEAALNRPPRGRRADAVVSTALFAISVAVHLLLSARMSGPVIETDEAGYIGVGDVLAHGRGMLHAVTTYRPLYGALLVPVELVTRDPTIVYRAALVINAVALGAFTVAVYALTRWLFDRRATVVGVAVALVVSAYPPFLAYGNITAEVGVFVLMCMLTCLAIARCARQDRIARWAVAAFLSGACLSLHPIGVVVVVAVAALAVGARRPWRDRARAMVGVLVGLQAAGIGLILLTQPVAAFNRAGVVRVTAVPAAVGVPVALRAPTHILLGLEAAGQGWYLVAATAGLVVLGLIVAAEAAWRVFVRGSRKPADFVGAFAGLVLLVGLYASAARLLIARGGDGQADALIYGRYSEHVLGPVLVLGLCELTRLRRRTQVLVVWLAGVAAVAAGCGWVLQHGRTAAAFRAPIVYANVFGLHPVLRALGGIDVAVIGAGAIGAAALVAVLARWRGLAVVAPVLLVAGLASGAYSADSMVRDSRARTVQRVVLHALDLVDRVAGAPPCIAYDVPIEDQWTLSNDQFFRPQTRFARFDSSAGQVPCSALVITARTDLERSYPGARVVAMENYAPTDLWVLRGPLLDRLAAAGLLLPARFPGPLPPTAYRSRITETGPLAALEVPPGGTISVRVAITNRGTGSPWPSRRGFAAGFGWVGVVASWNLAGTPPPLPTTLTGMRTDLARPLWPGETVVEDVALTAVGPTGRPLAPGRYEVDVGLVQEGVTFFAAKGDAPLRLSIDVSGGLGAGAGASAGPDVNGGVNGTGA